MPALYSAAIGLYHAGIRIAARWNPKARAWVKGREGVWERLSAKREALRGCLWMHCASVGEFEQGRPVLEAIKAQRPDLPVLVTFFSPSGHEARKDYALATHVDYLPADSAANADRLVQLIAPRAAMFVKYEFWYHYLQALKDREVPLFLVSGIFRPDQPFFSWYGGTWRAMLACFTHIFTQDERSRDLLTGIGVKSVSVSGDTRFDRVAAIAATGEELPPARAFVAAEEAPVLVCGSTWPADEALLLKALDKLRTKPRILIAPHELLDGHLAAVEAAFPRPLALWSELERAVATGSGLPPGIRTVLVDRMGVLARLYRYGDIAYVGGGFGEGIHSLLEAAAWGRPVIFGPRHGKFAEAQGLIDAGAGFEVKHADELHAVLKRLLDEPEALRKASEAAERYVRERVGATDLIVGAIRGKLER
jgi:3-deoxy-D-manno-octulosonic-acid transferase